MPTFDSSAEHVTKRTVGCDRHPPPTWQSIQHELDRLVADGVLEVVVIDGVERYMRTEAPDDPAR